MRQRVARRPTCRILSLPAGPVVRAEPEDVIFHREVPKGRHLVQRPHVHAGQLVRGDRDGRAVERGGEDGADGVRGVGVKEAEAVAQGVRAVVPAARVRGGGRRGRASFAWFVV